MPRTERNRAPGEGTLYEERSRNRWVGAVVIDGKRRKVTAKTKTEARQKLNSLTRSRDSGEQVGDGNTTVAQLVDKWMARDVASRSIAPSTLDTYRWSTRTINAGLGKRRVRELTTDDIENWLDKMSEAGLARSSLKKFRSTLRQALEFGERRGVVNRNAASTAKLTPGARATAERTALTPDQLRSFLTVCANERLGAMFAIQATVGVRPGEASGLCWDAVDLESGTITIRTAVRNEGKTRRCSSTDSRRGEPTEQSCCPSRWSGCSPSIDVDRRSSGSRLTDGRTAGWCSPPELALPCRQATFVANSIGSR